MQTIKYAETNRDSGEVTSAVDHQAEVNKLATSEFAESKRSIVQVLSAIFGDAKLMSAQYAIRSNVGHGGE